MSKNDKLNNKFTFNFADGSFGIAENATAGILINPLLPEDFYSKPVSERHSSHMDRWYQKPYILHTVWDNALSPTGNQYEVQCLDESSIDRPSIWGVFVTLDEALICAFNGLVDSKQDCGVHNSLRIPMFVSTNDEFKEIRGGSDLMRHNLLIRSIHKFHRLTPAGICEGCCQELTYLVFTGQIECPYHELDEGEDNV